jgi:DNA-binding CsgD family transcriptional regulator
MIKHFFSSTKDILLKITNPQLEQAFRIKSHLTTKERIVLNRLAFGKKNIIEIQ